ncbi:MAG TPA: M23 family metallopeptidase [Arenicellales bacterium]|nr:M23 family metallopeptidase [Arenicellales bacterium]
MSLPVFLFQVLVPCLLLLWLATSPAGGVLAFALQVLSVAALLIALWLTAVWAMPPFWVPYLYGAAFVAIVVYHLARNRIDLSSPWSAGAGASVVIVLVALAGAKGVQMTVLALQGRALPEVQTVDIAPPFGAGSYLVAHGGSSVMVNGHLRTLDPGEPEYHAWRGQSRALDILRIKPSGFHVEGWRPADPARYVTFGTPVLAPCDGRVALAEDGLPDMQVPEMDSFNKPGNYVAIDCGGFYVILAHLRQGSVQVAAGEQVAAGDPVGEMGNSGNSSEPHLHLHAQRGLPPAAPLSGAPLGLTLHGRFPVRNDVIRVE